MRDRFGSSFATRPLRAARSAIVGFTALVAACSDVADGPSGSAFEDELEEVGTLEQALFDSGDIRTTAALAMAAAYDRTLADGDRFEYCGLIVLKTNGGFRAGEPTTSRLPRFCEATVRLDQGEVTVGYYHTHTAASVPGLSPEDFAAAEDVELVYFVLSTLTGCEQAYDPATERTVDMGCPFG